MSVIKVLLVIGAIIYYLTKAGSKENKSRKPAPRAPQPQPNKQASQPVEEKSLDDIIRELAHTPKHEKPAPRERVRIKHIETKDNRPPEAISSETLPRRHEEGFTGVHHEEEEDDYVKQIFNLRQAVINDAILNRPDF